MYRVKKVSIYVTFLSTVLRKIFNNNSRLQASCWDCMLCNYCLIYKQGCYLSNMLVFSNHCTHTEQNKGTTRTRRKTKCYISFSKINIIIAKPQMIMTPHLNVKPQSTLTFTRNFIHDSHLLDVHIFHHQH